MGKLLIMVLIPNAEEQSIHVNTFQFCRIFNTQNFLLFSEHELEWS